MFFHSYKEAHKTLHIPGSYQQGTIGNEIDGITSLKLTSNHLSLDRISSDFQTIYYVGIGKKSSQGEPAMNQKLQDQTPFFVSKKSKKPFPVLLKIKEKVVYFPGFYTVVHIRQKISSRGFEYYEIQMKHVNKPHTYHE